jgi:2-polyprenyl-3-methyl-5-hydroxy-6-metoxy-1,4-benzoquinol methylase
MESAWPIEDLEVVGACPYCDSKHRSLAYGDVRDWTFDSAPGRWAYWDCQECKALYLDPRPTVASVGAAYGRYYTHTQLPSGTAVYGLKRRLINECWSHWLGADINPRLGVPRLLAPLLRVLYEKAPPPFELESLAKLPKGELLDVGCGSGTTLKLGALLGFRTTGLEKDPSAVSAARCQGLNVLEGTYQALRECPRSFDYLICSHVLEHVHEPRLLLELVETTLRDRGVAFISCPNSQSYVRKRFGASWRGLEAPRHLAIPSLEYLVKSVRQLGFSVNRVDPVGSTTVRESKRILKRRMKSSGAISQETPQEDFGNPLNYQSNPDLIQLICEKRTSAE